MFARFEVEDNTMPIPPQFLKKASESKSFGKRMPMGKAQDEGNKMMKGAISRKLAKRGRKSSY